MVAITRWFFAMDGQAAYYQEGDYIYSKDGRPHYCVSNEWWIPMAEGSAAAQFYVKGKYVYSKDGQEAFYSGS